MSFIDSFRSNRNVNNYNIENNSNIDISNLAKLLDPSSGAVSKMMKNENNGENGEYNQLVRPQSQVVGYSLQDICNSTNNNKPGKKDGNNAPNTFSLPSTVIDVQIGLPIPSMTKQGKEIAAKNNINYYGNISNEEKIKKKSSSTFLFISNILTSLKRNEIWLYDEIKEFEATITSAALVAPNPARTHVTTNSSLISSTNKTINLETNSFTANEKSNERSYIKTPVEITPNHDVLLQQRVGTEDVYLGVDYERDGSSSASEGLLVKVELPLFLSSKINTISNDNIISKKSITEMISLTVKPYEVILKTDTFVSSSSENQRLNEENKNSNICYYYALIPLPIKVIENLAHAKWDGSRKLLTITLTHDPSDAKIKVL